MLYVIALPGFPNQVFLRVVPNEQRRFPRGSNARQLEPHVAEFQFADGTLYCWSRHAASVPVGWAAHTSTRMRLGIRGSHTRPGSDCPFIGVIYCLLRALRHCGRCHDCRKDSPSQMAVPAMPAALFSQGCVESQVAVHRSVPSLWVSRLEPCAKTNRVAPRHNGKAAPVRAARELSGRSRTTKLCGTHISLR